MKHRFRRVLGVISAMAVLGAANPAAADGIRGDPMARFSDPLCPGVFGLDLETAEVIVSRIRENAAALSVRLAPEGDCKPNLTVAFLEDGQRYLERINSERGFLMDGFSAAERRDLLSQDGPARTWITVEVRTRDGIPLGVQQNLVDVPRASMWVAHSRIYGAIRRDITNAMVLIDRDAAEGLTVGQLADYATLRGLADEAPEAPGGVTSIQSVFDSPDAPGGLSEFDTAFLDRLYSSPANLPASAIVEGVLQDRTYRE